MRYIILILLAVSLFSNEDFKLVKLAYSHGLKPVPDNYESLLSSLNISSKELSKEKITLGKKLFFEKELSLSRNISCASCHSFDKGGADGIPSAIGHKNQENPFHLNTPTVLNTAFSKKFFWNGSSNSLQDQAKGPLQAPFEMSITPELAEKRMNENQEYINMFNNIFGSGKITFEKIVHAIAAYEKTLVTRGRYDDFLLGYFNALKKEEKEGLNLYITKGCVGCHNGIGLGGQVLRKFPLSFHPIWSMEKPTRIKALQSKYNNILSTLNDLEFKSDTERLNYLKLKMGKQDLDLLKEGFFTQIDENEITQAITLSACTQCHIENTNKIKENLVEKIAFPFKNKGKFLGSKKQQGYFRVPLLRNIVRTQPYFHNGEVKELKDAIKTMGTHQVRRNLSENDIEKIISFLKAVDGEIVDFNSN